MSDADFFADSNSHAAVEVLILAVPHSYDNLIHSFSPCAQNYE